MDYSEMLKKSMAYIEANLEGSLSFREVAAATGVSPYHFHRLFQGIIGMTVDTYIRGRKMTVAAMKLVRSDESILSIALDCGYESHEAFTRAFRRHFSVTPRMFRRKGTLPYFRLTNVIGSRYINMLTGGELVMEPKIVIKKAFKLVGIEGETNLQNNRIPKMWDEFNPRAHEVRNWKQPPAFYGVCEYRAVDEFTEETVFTELVGVEVSDFEDIPAGMVTREMPEQKYAVFTHKGSLEKLGETYDHIYKTWFPRSEYEFAERDDFELYDERFDLRDPEKSEMDIYIPIR